MRTRPLVGPNHRKSLDNFFIAQSLDAPKYIFGGKSGKSSAVIFRKGIKTRHRGGFNAMELPGHIHLPDADAAPGVRIAGHEHI
jgi:hypothetical protein